MKKRIDKDVAIEYIYEYGWSETAELFKISEEDLDNIVNENRVDWKKPHINVNATIDYINPKISEFIEKYYSELHSKYVKNKDYNVCWQNDEDILHTALIKLCSELSNPSESEIKQKFDKIFRDSKRRYEMNNRQIKRKEINSIDLVDNDEEVE